MFPALVRVRELDNKLSVWRFEGLIHTLDEVHRVSEKVIEDKGQFASFNIYTAEFIFKSSGYPIPVYKKDELEPANVWELNIWQYDAHRLVWGLECGNVSTQMSYELVSVPPQRVINDGPAHHYFYFDVGRELRVTRGDLEQGFKYLGLL